MKVIKAPTIVDFNMVEQPTLFLGGSIEMGKAEDWQTRLTERLKDMPGTIFNPRRDDWDSTWVQDPTPGTQFHEQVTWEMNSQDHTWVNVYWFVPGTMSPITLLELGAYGNIAFKETIVYCTKDFWRYGNVKIFCDEMGIPCFDDEDAFFEELKQMLIGQGDV